ncbi:MAG: molybdopterin molybdotransferase MoeA, partial [Eubacteriales bacterium]|nr:molybdopterin molybdotransferase MoeA [Eubacteriales bacterium]
LDLEAAIHILTQHVMSKDSQTVSLADAVGRVLAAAVIATSDVPSFDRTQVDGLAVRATDTFGASDSLPAILTYCGEVHMGADAQLVIAPGQCAYVPTGGMIPSGADAMVMIEYVEILDSQTRLVSQRVSPGQSITQKGDDTTIGQIILPAGRIITSTDIGALAALGLATIKVLPLLRIGYLSTGDELVDVQTHASLATGQIWDVNRPMLAAAIQSAGQIGIDYGIVTDQLEPMTARLRQALDSCDLVLLSGGSSAGTHDFVAQAIQNAGSPGVLFHGLAVKPGKPTMAGLCDGHIAIGLPGHPVAAWFMFEQLVKPLISHLTGRESACPASVLARLTCRLPSNHGRAEFVSVRLVADFANDQTQVTSPQWLATPLPMRSGLITQLTASDGYILVARDCEGLEAGTVVTVTLMAK